MSKPNFRPEFCKATRAGELDAALFALAVGCRSCPVCCRRTEPGADQALVWRTGLIASAEGAVPMTEVSADLACGSFRDRTAVGGCNHAAISSIGRRWDDAGAIAFITAIVQNENVDSGRAEQRSVTCPGIARKPDSVALPLKRSAETAAAICRSFSSE